MPANDKILYTDYNILRNAVANILGSGGSGNAGSGTGYPSGGADRSYGYGQTVQSSTVSGATGIGVVGGTGTGASSIRTDEYSKLRYDIINVYRHIYGTDPTPANPIIGQLIRWVTASAAVAAEYNVSQYNIDEYNATSIAGSADPYTQFSVFIADIQSNRFTCATSQSVTETLGTATRTTAWGGGLATISTRLRLSWTSAAQARYFFNSGGEIRIAAARTGGTLPNAQNTAWTNLLNSAATRTYSAQAPSTAFGSPDALNWYRLTNVYQSWYTLVDSGPYANNSFYIQARTLDGFVANNFQGDSAGVDLLVVFTDNYRDPDDTAPTRAPSVRTAPDDSVDGTLQVLCSIKRATGILQPEPSTGNFTIERPTLAITSGTTSIPNGID